MQVSRVFCTPIAIRCGVVPGEIAINCDSVCPDFCPKAATVRNGGRLPYSVCLRTSPWSLTTASFHLSVYPGCVMSPGILSV